MYRDQKTLFFTLHGKEEKNVGLEVNRQAVLYSNKVARRGLCCHAKVVQCLACPLSIENMIQIDKVVIIYLAASAKATWT